MSVLKRPLVTEKISAFNEKGVYGFVVSLTANKIEIKDEIEKTYGVNIESIRTMIYQGKSKSRFTKKKFVTGRTPAFKKAIVTVADGEVIDFYSGI